MVNTVIQNFCLFLFLGACLETNNRTDVSGVGHSVTDLTKKPSAKITHEEGWAIVSKIESGDRVYWFLAPEVDNISPAMFKKIVYSGKNSELETKIVSQCDAPKQTCDDLMKQFKTLSKKYN